MSVQVLFLAGMGRSGTTLVERVLSGVPTVLGLGEVTHLWERGVRRDELCGCGSHFSRCPFWSAVGESAFGGWHNIDVDEVLRLRARFDRVRNVANLLAQSKRPTDESLASYRDYYGKVYAAAHDITGAQLLVDSSKQASLPHVLVGAPDIHLRVLHCIRDARAVCYSWTKQTRRPEVADGVAFMPRYDPKAMAVKWTSHNIAAELVKLRTDVRRLKYEDFIHDPVLAVRSVLNFATREGRNGVALPSSALNHVSQRSVNLDTSHTVSGNPMRFRTGAVQLSQDEAWRTAMPSRQRRLVTAMTAPMLLRYGYPLTTDGDT
jgi:Sulfotransferase family